MNRNQYSSESLLDVMEEAEDMFLLTLYLGAFESGFSSSLRCSIVSRGRRTMVLEFLNLEQQQQQRDNSF